MNSAAAITAINLFGCEYLSLAMFMIVNAVTAQKIKDKLPNK